MTDEVRTAIFFHPDQVESEGKDLVGRRSAGESFLRGYLRTSTAPEIRAVTETADGAKALEAKVRALGDTRPIRATPLRGGGDFSDAGTIFFPTPGFMNATWLRQRFGQASCSLVGITHTVSTRRIIEGLHTLLSEPVEPWDAIICTSRAVQSVVARQFALEEEYLRQRFQAGRVPLPRLPVIPLGIETAGFAAQDGARERMRAAQDATEDAVVILTVGRLSVVEKANPWPLFVALERIAVETGRKVHLWITGWASRAEEEKLHRVGAAGVCKHVMVRMVDGRDADVRRNIWAGADIFTLPAESIQETYGLVPVEAMAAGLPVVMPDWDGFRDTVVHGETGFLVPTRMARPGTGNVIARRFADMTDGYLQYLTLVQAQIQLDVPAYEAAFRRLIENPDLRRTMGEAAQRHARTRLDWSAVVPQYIELAAELAELRKAGVPASPPLPSGPISPLEVDPFDLYAGYPTGTIGLDTMVGPGIPATEALMNAYDMISGRDLYKRRIVSNQLAMKVALAVQRSGQISLARLATAVGESFETTETAVLYLAKADVLRLPQIGPK
jgi:alpha-maltose-1-phosphate synthase